MSVTKAIGAAWTKSKLDSRQLMFRYAVQPVMNVHLSAPHYEVLPFGAVRFVIEVDLADRHAAQK